MLPQRCTTEGPLVNRIQILTYYLEGGRAYCDADLGAGLGGAAVVEGLVVGVDPQPVNPVDEAVAILEVQVVRLLDPEVLFRQGQPREAVGRTGGGGAAVEEF